MRIIDTICYTKLVYLISNQKFMKSISDFQILKTPSFDLEGIVGYIETDVKFTIIDFKLFSESYYSHTPEKLQEIRLKLKG